MTNTLPNTNAAATLAAIIARGQAAYVESLPDFARDFGADVEPTQPNITIADERQRELCLSCALCDCVGIRPGATAISAQVVAPNERQSVTRNNTPAKRSKLMGKPKRKRAAKPSPAPGYHWRQHGAGWDLRKDVYVTSHDGVGKRKQPYVAHLSREAFQELKRQNKGASLERAIAARIEEHDK